MKSLVKISFVCEVGAMGEGKCGFYESRAKTAHGNRAIGQMCKHYENLTCHNDNAINEVLLLRKMGYCSCGKKVSS